MFEWRSKLNSSQAAEKKHQTQNVNSSNQSFIAHYQDPTHGTAYSKKGQTKEAHSSDPCADL